MKPLTSLELDVQALEAAVEAESTYERVWLPPEPWWDALVDDKAEFARSVHRRLVRGTRWPRSVTIDVRKPGHGIRPVSLMSPEVRVAYRAIITALVPDDERVDRSAASYAEFVVAPIKAAFERGSGLRRFGDAMYSHVLVADVASFYQYIDHAILRDELDRLGRNIDLIDGLIELLGDIEGRSFGIPQRSAPSDWISEFYAARLERLVTRDGHDVWRYSDDVRVGCTSYPEVLSAIESLSRSARDIGLVLNDQKTATPSFLTYFMNNSGVEIDDASVEIDPSDVEASIFSDYAPEDDDQAVAAALTTLDLLWDRERHGTPRPEGSWNLSKLNAEQHREVRRALNTVTKHADLGALPMLLSILAYQPAMTHLVVRYAAAVAPAEPAVVGDFVDKVIKRVSLNEWQRAWIAYGIRACGLQVDGSSLRLRWLEAQANLVHSLAAAEAVVTLAGENLVQFRVLEERLRIVDADYAPWYLHAVSLLHQAGIFIGPWRGDHRESSAVAASLLK